MTDSTPPHPTERTDLTDAAARAILDGVVVAPPEYDPVSSDALDEFPAVEFTWMFGPEYRDAETISGNVLQMAFADAFNSECPTGIIPESATQTREGAVYYHSTWMTPEEATDLIADLPEMPRFEFNPKHVAEEVRCLPENQLVALGRENFGGDTIPVVYVWSPNPAVVHQFCHATSESEGLWFDAGTQFPLVDENGPIECDHVLTAPRDYRVCRIGFGGPPA